MEALKFALKKNQHKEIDWYKWMLERVDKRPLRDSTKTQHRIAIKALQQCGYFNRWADFTLPNIKLFDEWVRNKVNTQSSVHGYHKRIKPYIREAVEFELLETNPYERFHCPIGRNDKLSYLTDDERNRIETLELSGTMSNVRDCFIFCCYTGLAYSDMAKIKPSDIINDGGRKYIVDERQKTGSMYKLTLLPKAVEILERYNYSLPVLSNQRMNMYLKVIASACGITKNVTYHQRSHIEFSYQLNFNILQKNIA